MNAPTRVRLRIYGYVQGVSFRYYARQRAQALGLTGWVRNCGDGAVEAVAEGDAGAVEEFVDWAHHGPTTAKVDRVDVRHESPLGDEQGFRIDG